MPIKIPNNLPAAAILQREQVFVMTEDRAIHQDIRPLRLLFLNLMPKKIDTEIQYMRKLSNTPLQVDIELLRIDNHVSRNTPQEHLDRFYKNFEDVKGKFYDGMIVTGAPLDQIRFEDVTYWDRIETMLQWSRRHVTSTLFSCWAVAAALKVFYGLPMINVPKKISGVFSNTIAPSSNPLIRGFDDRFVAPQSRFIAFPSDVIRKKTDLQILAQSEDAGVFLAVSPDRKQVYVTGHPEYDADTLAQEYARDRERGKEPAIPFNYFPQNDTSQTPKCVWRSHASLLFSNWLNYYVYQTTPYRLPPDEEAKKAA